MVDSGLAERGQSEGGTSVLRATACVRVLAAPRAREAPVNAAIPEEEVRPAADDAVDRRAERELTSAVVVDAPALRVPLKEVEPDGFAAAARALERGNRSEERRVGKECRS